MTTIRMKQGEIKAVRFTITRNGSALDVSGADEIIFAAKKNRSDSSYAIELKKTESDFDMTDATDGIIVATISAVELDVGHYFGELEVALSTTDIDKSKDISVDIDEALIS